MLFFRNMKCMLCSVEIFCVLLKLLFVRLKMCCICLVVFGFRLVIIVSFEILFDWWFVWFVDFELFFRLGLCCWISLLMVFFVSVGVLVVIFVVMCWNLVSWVLCLRWGFVVLIMVLVFFLGLVSW